MINITYLPANDPFHAVFRMFVLFPTETATPCPLEVAKLLDFYVCFPALISDFKSPRDIIKQHNFLKKRYQANSYQITPKPAVIFRRMHAAQSSALNSLQSYGFLDREALREEQLLRTSKEMPKGICAQVERHRENNEELILYLEELKLRSLYGADGLRARSRLGEYRYDNV